MTGIKPILNALLAIHRDACVAMFTQSEFPRQFREQSNRADAVRECINAVIKTLPNEIQTEYRKKLKQKTENIYESIFFKGESE